MIKRLSFFLLLLSLSVSCVERKGNAVDDALEQLDEALVRSSEYFHIKQQRISTIENLLHSRGVTPIQQYHIYGSLYDEYRTFQFDKAKETLDSQIAIAREIRNDSLLNNAMLEKAMLLTKAGFYLEVKDIFSQIDTASLSKGQLLNWCNTRQKFLVDYQEYVSTSSIDVPDYFKVKEYQDHILEHTPDTHPVNRHISILRMIEEKDFERPYRENLQFIESLDKEAHDYAVQTYWQGFICENLDRVDEMFQWWAKSAMYDIRHAVKDNASLCSIAVKLSDPEDTDRAFRYITISLDDALFYNAKLRKVQIASTLAWILKTYTDDKAKQDMYRTKSFVSILCFAILMLLLSIVTVRLYVKGRRKSEEIHSKNLQLAEYNDSMHETEETLRRMNMELREANTAKEEYLGLFLSMCSGYLDKLKKTITREQYEAELRNFYKTFDTSFLQLYPGFVSDFNALLREDCRIVLKESEMLNTELRIFALIKLGITQSSHIASLLRYSVNTIYNYRAQIKNSALSDRENFEDQVKKIGSRG